MSKTRRWFFGGSMAGIAGLFGIKAAKAKCPQPLKIPIEIIKGETEQEYRVIVRPTPPGLPGVYVTSQALRNRWELD